MYRIYILNIAHIFCLYTKNSSYNVYKLIFNSSKPWVGGSNPSWITSISTLFRQGAFSFGGPFATLRGEHRID